MVGGLSIENSTGASSQLDMNDNDMVVNYTAGNSPIDTIGKLLKSGYNGGTWDGNGIASTVAHNTPGTALGYADAGDVGIGTFDGTAIAGDAVLVKYTYTVAIPPSTGRSISGMTSTSSSMDISAAAAPGRPATTTTTAKSMAPTSECSSTDSRPRGRRRWESLMR